MYDIFFIGSETDEGWPELRTKYPHAKIADNFKTAQRTSLTKFFWIVWNDVNVNDEFDFNFTPDEWSTDYIHLFKNNDSYDGICLLHKDLHISDREIKHRFFVNKKEIDILASTPRPYPIYFIDTYEDYVEAIAGDESTSEMIWCIWKNIEVIDLKIYSTYFSHHNSYDRNENHVYKNLCNDEDSYHGGVVLASKNKPISKKEIEHRYIINRKENKQIVSRYRYPRYIVKTYDDYLNIIEKETSPLFWCVWDNVEILDDSIWDFYYNPTDGRYDADREMHHVYKHIFRNEETYHNGVFLASTKHSIGKREFNHKYIITRKEHDTVVSKLKPYDIVFISYNEPDAEDNYNRLVKRFPAAKRIHGVKGIHQAHIEAAKICDTDLVWIVDGDAHILDSFNFDHEANTYETDTVHVWQSQNPINDLVYGYGGVKLLPRELTINVDTNSADMTTSISNKFKPMPSISNITAFNTDEFSTWKSAFRECVKLSSKTIKGQVDEETEKRLDVWCTRGDDARFGRACISGACDGRRYGYDNIDNNDNLKLINNFEWLYERFQQNTLD